MRFTTAIGVSIALHGVLAAGIAVLVSRAPGPSALATLDLSSVDLSFAEEEDATAAAVPSAPEPAPEPAVPPAEGPPIAERPDDPPPPRPEPPVPPEPAPDREQMTAPELPPVPDEPQKPKEERPQAAPSPAAAPRQAKIDAPPKPRRAIRPDYPKGARQRGEQGNVVLEIRVGAEGAVDGVEVVSSCGFPELDEAAVRAAKEARFTPAKAGGSPVASTARLSLLFRLR